MKLRYFLILAAVLGIFAHDGQAQGTPQCNQSFHFTGSGVAPIINTTAGSTNGCVGWRLTFRVTGFTAAKIEIDGSQDGITFAAIDSTLVQEGVNPTNWTSATVSNTIVVRAYLPFIQVNLVSVTGTGSLNTLMLGYVGTSAQQDNGGGGGGGGITALTKDVAATGPGSVPATVQGLEGTPFCTGFTPVQGSLVQYTINSAPNPCWEEVPPNTSGIQMFLSQTGISGVAGDANWQPGQAAGLLTYYLTDTASDVATYLQQTTLPYSPKTTLTYSALPNGASTIQNWATVPGIPNLSFIPAGAYQCHLHMLKSPFGAATIACEFVEVDSSGVDIAVIGTTDSITNPAQIETQYTLDFADGNVYTLASTSSRIVCRVIATAVTGAPNIEIFVGGTADSHMSLPSNTVDASNFVPYVGAVKTLDMGNQGVNVGNTAPSVIDPVNGVWSPERDRFMRLSLRSWQAQLAKIINHTASSQAVVCVIGDSWTAGYTITGPFTSILQAQFGNSGPGYVPFYSIDPPVAGTALSTMGAWTTKNGNTDPTVEGVDLYSTNSSDVATPGSKTITTTALVTGFVIHWYGQTGGGSFTWQIDGGSASTINTSSLTGYQTTVISGLTSAPHVLLVTITVAGSAGVTLLGADAQNSAVGVRVNALGHSGAQASNYTAVNAANWEAGITALGCNLAVLQLGVNDHNANVAPATYAASMATIGARVVAALPLADVMLISSPDNGQVSTVSFSDYAVYLRAKAQVNAWGFIDQFRDFGPYVDANSRALFLGNHHPNADGGRVLANLWTAYLTDGLVYKQSGDFTASTIGSSGLGVRVNSIPSDVTADGTPNYGLGFASSLNQIELFGYTGIKFAAKVGGGILNAADGNWTFGGFGDNGYKVDILGSMRVTGIPTFAGTQTTGSTLATFGSNCPAVTCTSPYTWLRAISADGSAVYIPVFK